MSNTVIQLKRSANTGNVPTTLVEGELGLNYKDGKLYYVDDVFQLKSLYVPDIYQTISANGTLLIPTSPTEILNFSTNNFIRITANTTTDTIIFSETLSDILIPALSNTTSTAQAAYNAANNVTPQIQPSFDQANAAFAKANAVANGANSYTDTAWASANLYTNAQVTSNLATVAGWITNNVAFVYGVISSNATSTNTYTESIIASNAASTNAFTYSIIASNAISTNAYVDYTVTANSANDRVYTDARVQANVNTINASITNNTASFSSQIAANVTALNGSITSNATALRLNTDAYITANMATANLVMNSRITSNLESANAYSNSAIAANVATLRGEISSNVGNTVSKFGDIVYGPLYVNGANGNLYASTVTSNNDLTAGATGLFRYDTANNFLGVNKQSPVYTLDVVGSGYFTGNVIIAGNLQVQGSFSTIATANLDVATNVITMSAGLSGATTPTSNNSLVINRGNQSNTYLRWLENGVSGGEWVISSNGVTDGIVASTENSFKDWSQYAAANAYKQFGLPISGTLGWSISNQANAAYATSNAGYATANAGYSTGNAAYATANAAYNLANTATVNITVIDDITNGFDSILRTFDLRSDANAVNIIAAEQLLVQIGGVSIPPFINTYDIVFGSGYLSFTKGYSIANTGNVTQISFASAPLTNMDCTIRVLTPNQVTAAQTKKYPFSPISIMTGY